ncbi:MAG TPA: XrtB/PEP-CTERM-associated polysaccharide biosynthesis outer membrane protein EpsL [Burkholderiales bacterium]|nr:XrtB/PEP-CTERM-associated polysaccharide biosynthesis outer membrane protein EpsL [Burkholderiales bacterium]
MNRVFKIARRFQIRHRLVLTAVCILVVGSIVRPAFSQEDARRVMLGGSVSHDSNLFRVPGLLGNPQSETITTGYVGLRIDKPYAQQRFFLDATATAYRYHKFSYLDFNGLDYRAAWYWHLTPRVTGTLSADRTQATTQFQDTLGRQSNVTTNENYIFSMDGWLFGGWHVLLGASQSKYTSEQAALQTQPPYREIRSEFGVRYLFQSGSEIAAIRRRSEGAQGTQLINNVIVVSTENYHEDQSELRGTWNLTPKSVLDGRLTYLDRRYEHNPQRDFYGTAGHFVYTWLPTGKLSLRLAATRSIVPWQGSASSNRRVSNALSIAPSWQATAKTGVYMSLQRTYDDYPSTGTERKDTTRLAVLGLNWLPLRNLSIGASVQRPQRSSNDPLVEYDATVARLSASLMF